MILPVIGAVIALALREAMIIRAAIVSFSIINLKGAAIVILIIRAAIVIVVALIIRAAIIYFSIIIL